MFTQQPTPTSAARPAPRIPPPRTPSTRDASIQRERDLRARHDHRHVVGACYTAGGAQIGRRRLVQPGANFSRNRPQFRDEHCGATPCVIETQTPNPLPPVFAAGSSITRKRSAFPQRVSRTRAHQWTKLIPQAAASPWRRIEDPTATLDQRRPVVRLPTHRVNPWSTSWWEFAVFVGPHPSSAIRASRRRSAGTIRDPLVYKIGEDYYHKDFGSGGNRGATSARCKWIPGRPVSLGRAGIPKDGEYQRRNDRRQWESVEHLLGERRRAGAHRDDPRAEPK